MSALMLLKIFSDCCICFAVLGTFPAVGTLPLLVPGLICGVAAGLAAFFQGKGWTALRRLCCLVALSSLLLSENTAQAVILAVPAVYTASVILRGRLELEYSGYRHFFIRSLVLLVVVYAVVNIWNFLTAITSEAVFQPDASTVLRYGLVHALCGIVLQRQLRLGVGYRAEGGRRQMATLLGIAGAIIAGLALAEPLLRKGMRVVLEYVVSLVIAPFAFVLEMILRLFTSLQGEKDKEVYESFVDYMENVILGGDGQQTGQQVPPDTPTSFDGTVIWGILVAIVLLVAAVLLIHSFRKNRADADPGEVSGRVLTAPKKKKEPPLSNRAMVRQLYRDFLRAEKGRGMKLRKNDTSADILQRIHPQTDSASADALRQVYLSARYDDRGGISRGQVSEARQALRGTRQMSKQ